MTNALPERKERCQSCGMPLGTPGGYGMEKDGRENRDWCRFCYSGGAFTQPDQTVDGMVASSVAFMTANLGFTKADAERMSREVIPSLKRWR